VVGYSAVALAGFTFYADRTLGWEATRSPWIIAAVAIYFVLNTFLTYWIWAVEAGEVYAGKRKTGETVCQVILISMEALYTLAACSQLNHRYPFRHRPKSSRVSTSCTSSINLPLGKSSRTSDARHPSPLGFRQMANSTLRLSAAGLLARLMF
jgi:hypothetical protein